MADSILAQIANPVLANIPGAIDAGRRTKERMRTNAANTALTNQKTTDLQNVAMAQQGVLNTLPEGLTPFEKNMFTLSVRDPEGYEAVSKMKGNLDEQGIVEVGNNLAMVSAVPMEQSKPLLKESIKRLGNKSSFLKGLLEETLEETDEKVYKAQIFKLLGFVNKSGARGKQFQKQQEIGIDQQNADSTTKNAETDAIVAPIEAGAKVQAAGAKVQAAATGAGNLKLKQIDQTFEDSLTQQYIGEGQDPVKARLKAKGDIKQGNLGPKDEFFKTLSDEDKRAYFLKSLVNVDLSKPQDSIITKANEMIGAKLGEDMADVWKGGKEAVTQNQMLDRVALALSRGAKTGAGQELILNMKSLAKTFGLPVGDLSEQEVIRKVSNEMALRLRNPASGLGLTGNTSNKDLDFLKASVIGLARTKEGNIAIIKAMRKFNEYKMALAQEQNRLIRLNKGSTPLDLAGKMLDFADNFELYSDEERAAIEAALPEGVAIGDDYLPPVFGNDDGVVPEGVPPGSKKVGTSNGKDVYEAPDGKRYMEE